MSNQSLVKKSPDLQAEKTDYQSFLQKKAPTVDAVGITASEMPIHMFDYQKSVTEFCLKQGRSGLFLDTGLGKTAIQLEWSRQALEASNGRALILTPLAVAKQIEREAHKFGYDARVIRDQSEVKDGINICNYDRLDKIDPSAFGAVSLDESSILKSFSGSTSLSLTSAFSNTRFRLCATATPAPNDHMELGQHSAFLSQMSAQEMLARWFINDTATASQTWRLKKSGVNNFWDWVSGWARAAQSPEDLGFDGSRFHLDPYKLIKHQSYGNINAPLGGLFIDDVSATNLHDIKRQTVAARADAVAALVATDHDKPWLIWCDTDYEADALSAAIPNSMEIRGSMTPEQKERGIMAFVDGEVRVLITKPKIAGQGMNFQHCARMAYVGRSFSYEAFYQSVRRCWRFGQKEQVHVHLIMAEGEDQIGHIIDRKADDHDIMKRAMAAAMKRNMDVKNTSKVKYNPQHKGQFPSWLKSVA